MVRPHKGGAAGRDPRGYPAAFPTRQKQGRCSREDHQCSNGTVARPRTPDAPVTRMRMGRRISPTSASRAEDPPASGSAFGQRRTAATELVGSSPPWDRSPRAVSRCPHPRSAHRAGRARLSDLLGNNCGVLTDTDQQRGLPLTQEMDADKVQPRNHGARAVCVCGNPQASKASGHGSHDR